MKALSQPNHQNPGMGGNSPIPGYLFALRRLFVNRLPLWLVVWLVLVTACSPQTPSGRVSGSDSPTAQAISSVPADYLSNGGGEPRSSAYWILWSSCGENNRSAEAKANGGREAGWILLDDLLNDPGMMVGEQPVANCAQGVGLLQERNLNGYVATDDAAYALSAQLLTAQLNLSVGAEACPAVEEAITASHLLLISLDFDGNATYLGAERNSQDRQLALFLTDQLVTYNMGGLCR